MRRKQILIGLFALIMNRTIGEPKSLQGGTERAFVTMCFFRAVTGGTGISGVVFARAVTGSTGANGLNSDSETQQFCHVLINNSLKQKTQQI